MKVGLCDTSRTELVELANQDVSSLKDEILLGNWVRRTMQLRSMGRYRFAIVFICEVRTKFTPRQRTLTFRERCLFDKERCTKAMPSSRLENADGDRKWYARRSRSPEIGVLFDCPSSHVGRVDTAGNIFGQSKVQRLLITKHFRAP